MFRQRILNLMTSIIICGFIFLSGCEKSSQQLKAEKEEVNKMVAANKAYDETHNSKPATDPALCENNPEGYLYISVGKELFRFNKDSPLVITEFFSEFDANDQSILGSSGIPKGCEGNPYRSSNLDRRAGVVFKRNFKAGRDDMLINFVDLKFGISEVPNFSDAKAPVISATETFKWHERNNGYHKNGADFICQDVAENLAHCVFQNWGKEGFIHKTGHYIANVDVYSIEKDLPYSFRCDPWVNVLHCETSYRLYPTVKIEYSINMKNQDGFKPSDFLMIDSHLRYIYESARVKK